MLRFLLLTGSFGFLLNVSAQKNPAMAGHAARKIDSLKKIILTEKNDTTIGNLYMTIGAIFGGRQLDSLAFYAQRSKDVGVKILRSGKKEFRKKAVDLVAVATINLASIDLNNSKAKQARDSILHAMEMIRNSGTEFAMATAYVALGGVCSHEGNLRGAEENFLKGMKMYNETNYKKQIAIASNNLALVYMEMGEFKKAGDYLFKSLKIKESLNDRLGMYNTYQNLNLLFDRMKDSVNQLKYLRKSIALAHELKDKRMMGSIYNSMGNSFIISNFDSALYYHHLSLQLRIESKDIQGEASTLYNTGEGYCLNAGRWDKDKARQRDYADKAIAYFKRSLKIRKEIEDTRGIIQCLSGLGRALTLKGNYAEAAAQIKEGLRLAEGTGHKERQLICLQALDDLYKKWGKLEQAYPYYVRYINLRDTLANVKDQKEVYQKALEFDYEKKNLADSLKNEEKLKVEEMEFARKEEKQNFITMVIVGFLVLMVIVSIIIFMGFKKNKKMNKILSAKNDLINQQNDLLEEKHKEITASIKYAKKIQTALMASDKYVERNIDRLKKK